MGVVRGHGGDVRDTKEDAFTVFQQPHEEVANPNLP
jgi:hypothetical protein